MHGLSSARAVLSVLALAHALGACGDPFAGGGSGGVGAGSSAGGSAGSAGGAGGTTSHGSGGAAGSGVGASGAAGTGSAGGPAGSPNGGNGGAPASECPCAAPTPSCVAGKCVSRGPSMVSAGSFFIDSTEVTVGQYAVFQTAKGADTSQQSPDCTWNGSYEPAVVLDSPKPNPKHPITNVDYCDAAAYCAWADKRLCGKIGDGPLQLPELADPAKSQWFAACAGPKAQPYPYGTAYQPGVCNDQGGALLEVASMSHCQGFYPGLFDMLGNAQEWTSACDATGCERIGGSFALSGTCSQSGLAKRDYQDPALGFRCCSR